jgi:D-glycero-alpha-D-manno-heptose 1-phosphate guanylyltransferase
MMHINEAIILAGGAGTRLRSVVADLPKPMADVAGRPFLSYQVDYLATAGVKHIVLSVGYLRERIMEWFGDQYRGIRISYSVEEEPLGTGGAIRESFTKVAGDNVLALNGDTWFPVTLSSMVNAHNENGCDLTMALKLMHGFERYGTVSFSEKSVTGFFEKGFRSQGYINGGVYLLHRSLVDQFPSTQRFSFESDFLEPMVQRIRVCPFVSDAYFIDIGIPEDYQRAQVELPSQMGEFR